jgi:carboxyl-terminal processing protease
MELEKRRNQLPRKTFGRIAAIAAVLLVVSLGSAATASSAFQFMEQPRNSARINCSYQTPVSSSKILLRSQRHDETGSSDFIPTTLRPTNNAAAVSKVVSQCMAMLCGLSVLLSPMQLDSTVAWAAIPPQRQQQQEESSLLVAPGVDKRQEKSVVEEVWGLVNKYYIDRTFNGNDWTQVHKKYAAMEIGADNDKSMELAKEMVQLLGDKYSRMLDQEKYAAIQKYDLIGVGVSLMPNAQKKIIVGGPPIENSPAAKAGLRPGDFVTAINGLSTDNRNAFDIIDQISENPTAKTVTFSIMRQGENDLAGEGMSFDVTMERLNAMEIKDPIQYKISETRPDGTVVGYIRLSEFNSLVKGRLNDALADLKSQGANAFVLDLRMNGGGAFQSAVEVSSFFLDNRVATYVVDSNQVELPFRTSSGRLLIDNKDPLAIWIDGMSASASEVLAGSLHDNCRAVTMGSQSFGKGLIQAVYGLENGSGLVLTVARYVTPRGTDIQGVGITPDIKGNVPPPPLIPVLSTDTSKVDFKEISKRLDPSMCKLPDERTAAVKETTTPGSTQ